MRDAFEAAPPSWVFLLELEHLARQHPVALDVLGRRPVAVLAHQILFKVQVSLGVRRQTFD